MFTNNPNNPFELNQNNNELNDILTEYKSSQEAIYKSINIMTLNRKLKSIEKVLSEHPNLKIDIIKTDILSFLTADESHDNFTINFLLKNERTPRQHLGESISGDTKSSICTIM